MEQTTLQGQFLIVFIIQKIRTMLSLITNQNGNNKKIIIIIIIIIIINMIKTIKEI